MSLSCHLFRLTTRIAAIGAVCFATLGASSLSAQTAPQLLPYTAKLVAGGGPTATYKAGSLCPVSGFTETDAYGDGCLANEIVLVSARYAVADATGNVFFSDYTHGLVRRVDAVTGIVTAVAGGATASPASGTSCGSYTSTDALGDGCLATSVKLNNPTGLAFDSNGNLFFADYYTGTVRKITATSGFITTSGVISLVAGNAAGTYGYNVNNTAAGGSVNAATQSYLNDPYGLAFDTKGNLYIADEGNNAVEVVNLTAATETIQGLTVPAGTIAKVVGYGSLNKPTSAASARSGDCPSFVSTSSRGGCYYATTFTGTTGVTANIDAAYSIAIDGSNNLYFTNEYNNNDGVVTASGSIFNLAGEAGTDAKANVTTRAAAGSFAIGSNFGIAADTNSNVYISDSVAGVIWRIDGPLTTGGSQSMYVVAGGVGTTGGPTSVCAGATDTYGDGCPALQAKLGSNGSSYSSTTAPAPGVWGVSVDANSNLYFGDTETALIREIATGAQFGVVGANQPTDTLDIHFATGDTPASTGAYQLTSGASNFSIGSATCTTNSDKTTDCLLSVTATPTVLGAFSGTLQVTSAFGRVSSFVLGGTYAQSPSTRTTLGYTAGVSCAGTTTYATTTSVTLTANVIANGPTPPVGSADTITFYANNGTTTTAIGTQPVTNLGTTTAPSYGATLNHTFSTVGTYTLTAVYSGDSYFKTSTGTSASTVTSATPSFSVAAVSSSQSTVAQGQTALYSFNVNQVVYTGTVSFAVSGLPANSTYSLSPTSITANGCSGTSTVALSVFTTPQPPSSAAAIGLGGRGPGSWLAVITGAALALLIGLRRKQVGGFAKVLMLFALLAAASGLTACNSTTVSAAPPTPTGSYQVTVTATGSAGGTSSVTFPLTVK